MSAIVQINFPYTENQADLETHAAEAAPRFTAIDGLLWKIWLVDEASKTTGGIYQFATREQAQAYADGDIVKHLKNVREGIEVKVFDTIEAAGKITRAPA